MRRPNGSGFPRRPEVDLGRPVQPVGGMSLLPGGGGGYCPDCQALVPMLLADGKCPMHSSCSPILPGGPQRPPRGPRG